MNFIKGFSEKLSRLNQKGRYEAESACGNGYCLRSMWSSNADSNSQHWCVFGVPVTLCHQRAVQEHKNLVSGDEVVRADDDEGESRLLPDQTSVQIM